MARGRMKEVTRRAERSPETWMAKLLFDEPSARREGRGHKGTYKVGSESFIQRANIDSESICDPTMRCDIEPPRGTAEDAVQ